MATSRIVMEPVGNYPRIVFDYDPERDRVVITVGDKTLSPLSTDELSSLHFALIQVVNHDFSGDAPGPRAEEPKDALPPE